MGCREAHDRSAEPVSEPVSADDLSAWKARAEQVRGLRFEREIELVRIEPAQIPALIQKEIDEYMTPEEGRAYADAYAALGLLPRDLDLVALMRELYGQQLAGLYDPQAEKLYVRKGDLGTGYPVEVVAVHELVHALEHQHFPQTIVMQSRLEHQDDLSTMLSVVTEGDASFAAFALAPSHGRTESALGSVRDEMMKQVDDAAGAYGKAPRPLRMRFVIPYAEGLTLAARAHEKGGNEALDAWLREPPLSTLPLVAPDAPARPVEMIRLPLDWLEREVRAKECKLGHHDVMGPLMIEALFQERGAPASADVAAGWSGDRFVHVSCAKGSELLWITRWSTAEDAARFAAAYLGIAPAVARVGPLASVPQVSVSERTVVVRTRALEDLVRPVEAKLELRPYSSFSTWIAEGCFPADSCPRLR